MNGETYNYGSKEEQLAAIVRLNCEEQESLRKVANGKSKMAALANQRLEQSIKNNEPLLVQLRQSIPIDC